ncbi:MAG: hypothetical protein LBU77_03765 [Clostridiales bacterium]|jgi:hypothetical protein|nr:hypothetical protein [Clostridiales bacterium]
MKLFFTEEQKANEENKAEIDDVLFRADFIEGQEKNWILTGSAVVDGETYTNFTVEIETAELPAGESAAEIMAAEWEWYDFLFD